MDENLALVATLAERDRQVPGWHGVRGKNATIQPSPGAIYPIERTDGPTVAHFIDALILGYGLPNYGFGC